MTSNVKTVINIKADKVVKERAQIVADRLGVPLSTIINAFLKQFILSEEVTFSAVPKMTSELEAVLDFIEKDIKVKKNITKSMTVKEAASYLSTL